MISIADFECDIVKLLTVIEKKKENYRLSLRGQRFSSIDCPIIDMLAVAPA
jgi:hypothetical protein